MAENAVLDVPPGFAKVSGFITLDGRSVSILASVAGSRDQTYLGLLSARPCPGSTFQTVQQAGLRGAEWGGVNGEDAWCESTGILYWDRQRVTAHVRWETVAGLVAVRWWLVNDAGQTVWTSGDAQFPSGQAMLIVPE